MANEIDIVGDAATNGIDIISVLTNPAALIMYGVLITTIVFVILYVFILKPRKEEEVFEFSKFEDTVFNNLQKTFKLEGHKSKARLLHGFKNPLGSVDKWLHHKGEWSILRFDPKGKKYEPITSIRKVEKKDKKGKPIMDKKGKPKYDTVKEEKKEGYDLWLFKVKGESIFGEDSYIIVDDQFLNYDPKGNKYTIDQNVPLHSFGKAWITSTKGEQHLSEVSFRKSIENNMTYLQNYAGKIIFIETSHAKALSKIEGKATSKSLGYQTYATNTLVRDATSTEESEDET